MCMPSTLYTKKLHNIYTKSAGPTLYKCYTHVLCLLDVYKTGYLLYNNVGPITSQICCVKQRLLLIFLDKFKFKSIQSNFLIIKFTLWRGFIFYSSVRFGCNPVNTKHLYNIYTMLDQRRRIFLFVLTGKLLWARFEFVRPTTLLFIYNLFSPHQYCESH